MFCDPDPKRAGEEGGRETSDTIASSDRGTQPLGLLKVGGLCRKEGKQISRKTRTCKCINFVPQISFLNLCGMVQGAWRKVEEFRPSVESGKALARTHKNIITAEILLGGAEGVAP